MTTEKEPLLWLPEVDAEVVNKMFQYKLDRFYQRPTRLDIIAQKAIVTSKMCTCLFYEVGAVLFYVAEDGNFYHLSDGYNGASKGDVDPRFEGCARVIGGKLHQGKDKCRGSHAERNAINNLSAGTFGLTDLRMMVTLHPCYECAKQIVNKGIKTVYYVWEYGREDFVTDYLKRLRVDVQQYNSAFLTRWIERNGYDPVGLRHHEP
ncbi:MAG: deaminase [Patescibacteria group bacterium]|nr:deaminase [Patescibacteria group bacterium]